MLCPVYIHAGDAAHAHGVTFPDFPGCFSAADDWDQLPAMIQEAVEVHFYGEEAIIPAPTPLGDQLRDAAYQGGAWMLFDIDLSKVSSKPIRLNISLPESLVREIDAAASSQHLTRSGFLAQAALRAMHPAHPD